MRRPKHIRTSNRCVLTKAALLSFSIPSLLWAASDSASLPAYLQPPPSLLRALIVNNNSLPVSGPLAEHNSGSFAATVSGSGHVGRGFTRGSDPLLPSFEFPRDSRVEYLNAGTIWVGGIVGGDTMTSVGRDGWIWWSEGEFHPVDPDNALSLISGPADQNFESRYADTLVTGLTWDPIDGFHHPLKIEVRQRSLSWRAPEFQDFLIVEYHLRNIGPDTIKSAWVGLYFDADVGYRGSATDALPTGQNDDLAGFLSDQDIGYIIDNDGHSNVWAESWDSTSQRAAIGAKIIDFSPVPRFSSPNFNWWRTGFDTTTNWGPRRSGTPEDPFRVFREDILGTPIGDANKYYLLSHREQDYDQLFSAIDHTADGWREPSPVAAGQIALGAETRFVLSNGGVDLVPSDTLRFVVAIAIGRNTHISPDNFRNYFDPFWPDFAYGAYDFTELQNTMAAAESLYRSGYDAPVYSPPPAPRVVEMIAGANVEWVYSSNRHVQGYDIYFRRIPERLIFCDIAPTDTLPFSDSHKLNAEPHTSDTYTLDNLSDGEWYQVAVAITPPEGTPAELSDITVFKYGRPAAPVLQRHFTDNDQRLGNYIIQSDETHLQWDDNNTDAAYFNIYRFPEDVSASLSPSRVELWNQPCEGEDLQCDSLIASNGKHLCAFRSNPHAVVSAGSREFRETVQGAAKYHYLVTTVDRAGAESPPSQPLTVYTVPGRRKSLAVFIADTTGSLWLTRWDSVSAYYHRALDHWSPDVFRYADNGSILPRPRFSTTGQYDIIIFDGAGLSSPLSGNEFTANQSWLTDYTRTGGTVIYMGSGLSFGFSPSTPGLFTRGFDKTRTAYEIFGIDSTTLISRGSHHPANVGDSLYHYFQPVGASPEPGSLFPALTYSHSGFYATDDYNTGPLPFKGVIYPRQDNTEVVYQYISGREPVSALQSLPVGIRYSSPTHTAYTFLISPWEWPQETQDAFFRELLGDIQTGAPGESGADLPESFTLEQNFPNPFNPATTISYALPALSQVNLTVYNILGQKVQTLVNTEQEAGKHKVVWRPENLATGIYFYRLKAGNEVYSKKMMLLK